MTEVGILQGRPQKGRKESQWAREDQARFARPVSSPFFSPSDACHVQSDKTT